MMPKMSLYSARLKTRYKNARFVALHPQQGPGVPKGVRPQMARRAVWRLGTYPLWSGDGFLERAVLRLGLDGVVLGDERAHHCGALGLRQESIVAGHQREHLGCVAQLRVGVRRLRLGVLNGIREVLRQTTITLERRLPRFDVVVINTHRNRGFSS